MAKDLEWYLFDQQSIDVIRSFEMFWFRTNFPSIFKCHRNCVNYLSNLMNKYGMIGQGRYPINGWDVSNPRLLLVWLSAILAQSKWLGNPWHWHWFKSPQITRGERTGTTQRPGFWKCPVQSNIASTLHGLLQFFFSAYLIDVSLYCIMISSSPMHIIMAMPTDKTRFWFDCAKGLY